MLWETLLLAQREIRRNVLTILGIVIGVAVVITMVTVGNGATEKVTSDIAKLGSNMLHVRPGQGRHGPGGARTSADPFDAADVAAIQREVSGLRAVAPTAASSGQVIYGNENWSTSVTGSTNAFMEVRDWPLDYGRRFTGGEMRAGKAVCILGKTDITNILVSAADGVSTEKVKADIERLMRERRHMGRNKVDDFNVRDMKEIVSTLTGTTRVLTALLGAVAAVSLLVGGIGIMNIMLVSVTERTREIGTRLAIGALEREVLMQFLVEAVVLSSLGGLCGIALGLGAAAFGASALSVPFIFDPGIVAVAFAFSAAVGVLFGYVPARKAARLDSIEALRHE